MKAEIKPAGNTSTPRAEDDRKGNHRYTVANIKDTDEAKLVIRNVNGVDLLFLEDGRLLANQGCEGHIYYINGESRYKTFRTAFLVDHKNVDTGRALKRE